MPRTPRPPSGPPGVSTFVTTESVLRPDAPTQSRAPLQHRRRRLSLAELLTDPEESERYTRATMWSEQLPAMGAEVA